MNFNSFVWNLFTRYAGYWIDNAWLMFLLAGFLLGGFVRTTYRLFNKDGIVLQILAYIDAYMAMYYFPFSHNRMHVSLTTTTNLIFSSSSYGDNLQAYLGKGKLTASMVMELLYRHTATQRIELQQLSPFALYRNYFETYDQITRLGVVGDATRSMWQNGWISALILITVSVFALSNYKFKKTKIIMYLILLMLSASHIGLFAFVLGMMVFEKQITKKEKQEYEGEIKNNNKQIKISND